MTGSVIPERNRLAVNIVKFASRAILSHFFKINVRGLDNIPERESFVILPKHQRWEDIPLIAISINRPLYYVAKQELFSNRLSKKLIAMLGGLPLDRDRPNRSRFTFSKVVQKLEEKEGIVIFPEGTYYKNHMGPGHSGFIRMIYSNINTLYIPLGICYYKERKKAKVRLTFGEPVKAEEFRDAGELFSYVMNSIAELSGLG